MSARPRIPSKSPQPAQIPTIVGLTDLAGSVLRVGKGGRGFVVATSRANYVITAAHVLRPLPPAHLMSHLEERTYLRFIGPRDAEPTIAAECLFADPVADIAVLGPPDNQAFGDECDQYEAFTAALPPFDIAVPPPPSRLRVLPLNKTAPPGFEPSKVAFSAHLLSLEGAWLDVTAHYGCGVALSTLSTTPEKLTVGGMSGSPLISTTGAAIGVVSTSNMVACLANSLPGWLLRKLACA
jgi:hypothetical protein